jgi:hypothetical protein
MKDERRLDKSDAMNMRMGGKKAEARVGESSLSAGAEHLRRDHKAKYAKDMKCGKM